MLLMKPSLRLFVFALALLMVSSSSTFAGTSYVRQVLFTSVGGGGPRFLGTGAGPRLLNNQGEVLYLVGILQRRPAGPLASSVQLWVAAGIQ